ncbi:hypothetical protein E2C01_041738 [Portunus trituberculatus]|uniref:Uncharacterized protein n=1 Tax=Portunus trituberculatus TaxID=210409 RepID=A0A5B7FRI5_PORTR|nr:hypothetical protein [Portunus trituberculatus]
MELIIPASSLYTKKSQHHTPHFVLLSPTRDVRRGVGGDEGDSEWGRTRSFGSSENTAGALSRAGSCPGNHDTPKGKGPTPAHPAGHYKEGVVASGGTGPPLPCLPSPARQPNLMSYLLICQQVVSRSADQVLALARQAFLPHSFFKRQ